MQLIDQDVAAVSRKGGSREALREQGKLGLQGRVRATVRIKVRARLRVRLRVGARHRDRDRDAARAKVRGQE